MLDEPPPDSPDADSLDADSTAFDSAASESAAPDGAWLDDAHLESAAGPDGEPPAGPPLGPEHIPPRPGVSLIDAGLGAGYLVSRIAVGPARTAVRVGHRLAPPARRALRAPATRGITDLSAWVLHTLAQVGAPQRTRAERRLQSLTRSATSAVAANQDVGRLVAQVASREMGPLIDEALPLVLGRLDEQPEQVRKIVQGQSRGIMAEARDTARTGARRGDHAIDAMVDRLLRRRVPPAQTASTETAPAQPRAPGR